MTHRRACLPIWKLTLERNFHQNNDAPPGFTSLSWRGWNMLIQILLRWNIWVSILTWYATWRNSNGFVLDTATSLTHPSGRSFDETASDILCFTDEIFDAISMSGSAWSEDVDDAAMLNFEGSIGCNSAAAIDARGQQREGLSIWDGIDEKYENDVAIRRVDEVAYAATAIRLPMSNMLMLQLHCPGFEAWDGDGRRATAMSMWRDVKRWETRCCMANWNLTRVEGPTRGIDLAGNIIAYALTPTRGIDWRETYDSRLHRSSTNMASNDWVNFRLSY